MEKGEGCLLVILAVVIFLLSPILTYCLGWLGGWLLIKIVGSTVVTGLNTLFGTTRFMTDLIPVVCGVLAVVGSYFKTSVGASKN